jgi:hypothetical protein
MRRSFCFCLLRERPGMHHQTISLDLAGAIIEDRIDGPLYAAEGWHPDLGRVLVIEGSAEAVLVSEVPLPEI